jgi:hypothetical protein
MFPKNRIPNIHQPAVIFVSSKGLSEWNCPIFKKLANSPASMTMRELELVYSFEKLKVIPLIKWNYPTIKGFQECLCVPSSLPGTLQSSIAGSLSE